MVTMVLRNLLRRKRRSFITASTIGFGLWLAILYMGMHENGYDDFIRIGAQTGMGSATVVAKNYNPNQGALPQRVDIKKERDLVQLAPFSALTGMLPRIVGDAVIGTGLKSTGASFVAIDPASDRGNLNYFYGKIREGNWLSSSSKSEVLVGELMARRLGVKIGSDLIYTTTDGHGNPISLMATLVGLFTTGNDELDGHYFILSIGQLRSDLGYSEDSSSFVALFFDRAENVDSTFNAMVKKWDHSDLALLHWQETRPDLATFLAADRLVYRVMLFFVGLIIASGVFTCMIMNVTERRRELGTMLALGSMPGQLFFSVLAEAGVLAVLGTLFGLVLIAPFYYYLRKYGIDLSEIMAGTLTLGGVTSDHVIISCRTSFAAIFVVSSILLLLSFAAAAYPAAKAALTLPIKTIRE